MAHRLWSLLLAVPFLLLVYALGSPASPQAKRQACVNSGLRLALPLTKPLWKSNVKKPIKESALIKKIKALEKNATKPQRKKLRRATNSVRNCFRVVAPNPTPEAGIPGGRDPVPNAPPTAPPVNPEEMQELAVLDSIPNRLEVARHIVQPIFLGPRSNRNEIDGWQFEVSSAPTHGTLKGQAPYLRYLSSDQLSQPDSLGYRARAPSGRSYSRTIELVPVAPSPEPQTQFKLGSYELGKLHLYLERPASNASCDLWLGIKRYSAQRYMSFLVRTFDPEEHQKDILVGEIASGSALGASYDSWIPLRNLIARDGTHIVRILSGDTADFQGTVDVFSNCQFPDFGFSQAHEATAVKPSATNVGTDYYVFIPPHVNALSLRSEPSNSFQLFNSQGQAVTANSSIPLLLAQNWNDSLANGRTYRLRVSTAINLYADGFPLILTRSASWAAKLRAGMEISDGKLFAHKHQVLMHQKIRELLTGLQPNLQWLPSFATHFNGLTNSSFDPYLHIMYGRAWNTHQASIESTLRSVAIQDTDPNHFWAGSPGFHPRPEQVDGNNLSYRWDQYWIGNRPWQNDARFEISLMPRHWGAPGEAAALAAFDHSSNPLYRSSELVRRLVAGSLFSYQVPQHSEFGGWGAGYAGNYYFSLSNYGTVFHYLAPLIEPELRDLWAEGIRNLLYYHYTYGAVGAANQYFYYLTPFLQFASSSSDPYDRIFAEHRIDQTMAWQNPAGFFMEAYGDDGHYNESSRSFLALAANYFDSPNPKILEGLDKSFRLLNVSWAFEPDGSRLGSSASYHRTPWPNTMSNASRFVDQYLDEASTHTQEEVPWYPAQITRDFANDDWGRGNDAQKMTLARADRPDLSDTNFLAIGGGYETYKAYISPPTGSGIHPSRAPSPTQFELGNQLFAIKRSYFASVNYGIPGLSGNIAYQRSYYHMLPPPNDEENRGGQVVYNGDIPNSNGAKMFPFPYNGGGLSLLHRAESGTQLLSMNWGPLSQHGIVLITPSGKRLYSSYMTVTKNLQATLPNPRLCVDSSLIPEVSAESPASVQVKRCYTFNADNIDVQVSAKNISTLSIPIGKLIEVIPVPVKTTRGVGKIRVGSETFDQRPADPAAANYESSFATLWPPSGRRVSSSSFSIQIGSERAFQVQLDATRPIDFQMNGLSMNGHTPKIGRANIVIAENQNFSAGHEITLSYRLTP